MSSLKTESKSCTMLGTALNDLHRSLFLSLKEKTIQFTRVNTSHLTIRSARIQDLLMSQARPTYYILVPHLFIYKLYIVNFCFVLFLLYHGQR